MLLCKTLYFHIPCYPWVLLYDSKAPILSSSEALGWQTNVCFVMDHGSSFLMELKFGVGFPILKIKPIWDTL